MLLCKVLIDVIFVSSPLHRAFRRIIQSAHQLMHIRKMFNIKTLKIAPTCFDPKIIFKELHCSLLKYLKNVTLARNSVAP